MQASLQGAITRLIYSIMQMQVKDRVHKSAYVRNSGSGIEIHINTEKGSLLDKKDTEENISKRIRDLKLEALGEAVHVSVEILTNMIDADARCLSKDYFSVIVNQDAKSTLVFNSKKLRADKINKQMIDSTKVVFHENAERLNSDIMFVNTENPTIH